MSHGTAPNAFGVTLLVLTLAAIPLLRFKFARECDDYGIPIRRTYRTGNGVLEGDDPLAYVMARAKADGTPNANLSFNLRRPDTNDGLEELRALLRTLKFNDICFNVELFLERCEMTHVAVTRARLLSADDEISLLVTPRMASALQLDIAALQRRDEYLLYHDFTIVRSGIAAIRLLPDRDEIDVHFDLRYAARTYETTGKHVSGTDEVKGYGETWTFVRKKGALTVLHAKGVLMHLCARCGGTIDAKNFGNCMYCDAQISRGEIDWTVDHIAPSPYRRYDPSRSITDLSSDNDGSTYMQQQATVNISERFLSRAKIVIEQVLDLRARGEIAACSAYASQTLYVAWAMQHELRASGEESHVPGRLTLRELTIAHHEQGAIFDRVTLLVRGTFISDRETDIDEYWTFKRKSGVASVEKGIAECACPRCGAELCINNIGVCAYCDVLVTSGDFDWVVSRVTRVDEPDVTDHLIAFLTRQLDHEAEITAMSQSTLFNWNT